MRTLIALALTLAAPAALHAQRVDIRGGVYTGASLPVGDLHDKDGAGTNNFFGAHVGGHLDFNLTPQHQVRGHITFIGMPGSEWDDYADHTNDISMLQVGADWVYHFQGQNRGWYSVAGASLNRVRNDWDNDLVDGSATQSGKLGVRGGAGYIFNRLFALEGTLNQVSVKKSGSEGLGFSTATWLQVSAVFRFGGR